VTVDPGGARFLPFLFCPFCQAADPIEIALKIATEVLALCRSVLCMEMSDLEIL